MLAALVKGLGVVGVNCGDILTQVCNTWVTGVAELTAIQEIIELIAG